MKILDACCGKRSFWFNKNHPDVTYIDIRKEVAPDRVMDCKKTDFDDETFNLIVFDPPHVPFLEKNKGIFSKKYGAFTALEIKILIKDSFLEFKRILKKEGFVVFKWNTHSLRLETILSMIQGFEILFGHLTAYKTKHSSQTYWMLLKKADRPDPGGIQKWLEFAFEGMRGRETDNLSYINQRGKT